MRPIFVYGLVASGVVRYVGQTMTPRKRENEHRRGAHPSTRQIGPHRFIILDVAPDYYAGLALEIRWIEHLSRREAPLVNRRTG